jgi:hypothetical protein
MHSYPPKRLLLAGAIFFAMALPSSAEWLLVRNWTIRTPIGRFGFEEILLPMPTMTVTQAESLGLPTVREVPVPGAVRGTHKRFLLGPFGELQTSISATAVKATTIGIVAVSVALTGFTAVSRSRGRRLAHAGAA